MDLEAKISQVVFLARAYERALHDPGPWEMAIGDLILPAERITTDEDIIFIADVPADVEGTLVLRCAGEEVLVQGNMVCTRGQLIEWKMASKVGSPVL